MNAKVFLRALIAASHIAGASAIAGPAHADLFVISHSATPVAAGDIKDIFTGEKQFLGNTKLVPVDNGPVQEAFLSEVLGMGAARYNTIWTKKAFREGKVPPSVKAGDNEVIDFVGKTPGAVGYVRVHPANAHIVKKY